MNDTKDLLCIVGTILICIIFPPALLLVIPYLLFRKKGDRSHVGGKEWTNINDVVIKDVAIKEIFNFYKTLLLDKVKTLEEALNDSEMMAQYGNIIKSEYNNALNNGINGIINSDTEDDKYLSAMRLDSIKTFPSANLPQEVIFNPREVCYYYTKLAAIDTIKNVRTDISYIGFRATQGGFRLGNMSVSSDSVEGIKRFDAGLLVITNQRLIFKGVNNHTKTIGIGTIIGVEKFEDNGVIIFLNNRETPIIIRFIADKTFYNNEEMNAMSFNNDLNWFERALSEILKNR